ncbi:class I SAM-dependent methyltransferase (plasmid) [Cereibacter azotoformans]|uniref:class I SAM-dependent methyltransferase n=1 Tax=Cereibacter azotoformans TaxID=43057 RepID=UPI001EEBC853|nr:methyltransferase domain-containing protein [Cereibacter azotoformans]ULB12278.1 class I SAM-dependent methyltransferase [Cereibacter azotoformans]
MIASTAASSKRKPVSALVHRVVRKVQVLSGYDPRNWLRIRQIEAFTAFLNADDRRLRPVLEISPGWNKQWQALCADYHAVDYPDFDICIDRLPAAFDTVIADQVLEHVSDPVAAVRNIHAMLKPDGWAMIATPFLFRVHARPHDYTRWTEAGLRQLLVKGGFAESDIHASSWGNKACAKAHIGGSVRSYGLWRDLSNDEEYPMMVWAFARKRAA